MIDDVYKSAAWSAWRVALRETAYHAARSHEGHHATERHAREQTLTTRDERKLFEDWWSCEARLLVFADESALAHAAWEFARSPQTLAGTHSELCYEHAFADWWARFSAHRSRA